MLVISGFRRDVEEIFALLGCYAAWSFNPLSSRIKKSKKNFLLGLFYP
jgi:hypothetical protein